MSFSFNTVIAWGISLSGTAMRVAPTACELEYPRSFSAETSKDGRATVSSAATAFVGEAAGGGVDCATAEGARTKPPMAARLKASRMVVMAWGNDGGTS